MMDRKVKITFVLPDVLQKEFKSQVIKDGYDMRGKSRWVEEGIYALLNMSNYPELVHLSNEMKGFEKADSIVISKDLKKLLDNCIVQIRKVYPMIEGVQSGVIRTAILQRLLHS